MSVEFSTKLERIVRLLAEHDLDALLLQGVANFAWATCGGSAYVNTADTRSMATLLFSPEGRFLITNNIEAQRLKDEEVVADQGWEFVTTPWEAPDDPLRRLTKNYRLGADGFYSSARDLSAELTRLRMNLLPAEQERFREVCRGCATAMDQAIRQVEPGMSEFEIAALLNRETQRRGITPIVNLIAVDERIYAYRHPLPTEKPLSRYAMLILCGRKYGLVGSITRFVHFGRLDEELKRKAQAVAGVDATFLHATRPGRSLAEIFNLAREQYVRAGFAEEWRLHHQGGAVGYTPRELVATLDTLEQVSLGQAYAWNPSITGTKSEDTILVLPEGNEILTEIPGWPSVTIETDGHEYARPAILELD